MPFDHFDILALVQELRQNLVGCDLTDAILTGEHDLWLELDRSAWLCISASPHLGRMLISSGRPTGLGVRPPDDRWESLRGTIEDVLQQDRDRIVRIRLRAYDRIGTETRLCLVVELTGRNNNAILLDEGSDKIMTSVRKIPPEKSRVRQILPGVPYRPPPPPDRPVPGRSSYDDFARRLLSTSDRPLTGALTRVLSGADALIVGEICYTSGVAPHIRVDELSEESRRGLWAAACALYEHPPWIRDGAHLIFDERGELLDFSAIELTHVPPDRKRPLRLLSQAIETFYRTASERWERERLEREIRAPLDRELAGLRRTLRRIEGDWDRCQNAELFQRKGHLLMAALHKIPRGAKQIELEDYYRPGASKIDIELDPRLSPVGNAQRYFAMYRKARDGASVVEKRLTSSRAKLEVLIRHREHLEEIGRGNPSAQFTELQRLKRELLDEGILRKRRSKEAKDGDKKGPRIAPRRYVTSDGWTVLVGRNNAENDLLTHRVADRDDTWFHAQGCPGSHVVLRRAGRKGGPSARTLEEAAALAAYWSKARGSTAVPVDYTLVKHVTKPRGGAPGLARIQREKTLTVRPRLLPQEDAVTR